jgi:hypothetical protein
VGSEVRRDVEELTDLSITTLRSGSNGLPLWNQTAYLIRLAFSRKKYCVPNHYRQGVSADNREDHQDDQYMRDKAGCPASSSSCCWLACKTFKSYISTTLSAGPGAVSSWPIIAVGPWEELGQKVAHVLRGPIQSIPCRIMGPECLTIRLQYWTSCRRKFQEGHAI